MDDEARNSLADIERDNVEYERASHQHEGDDGELDEVIPEDDDTEQVRHALDIALRDTRLHPGLPLDAVASTIIQAFSRDELAVLVNRINKSLDA